MADDWQAGDLALCMGDPIVSNCRRGAIYTVTAVIHGLNFASGIRTGLVLDGVQHPVAFAFWGVHACAARCFRKIRPHTPDAEDAETIRLLNGKPLRKRAITEAMKEHGYDELTARRFVKTRDLCARRVREKAL